MFNTPILFIIFNRLDTAKMVFETIREMQPKQLFIAADGPRKNVSGEYERCEEVRAYVMSRIDWNCEVKTLFRDENLGCGRAVSGAITWFFEQVEQGIILEDDCLPSLSFFSYCEKLLARYKDDERVWCVSGWNPLTVVKSAYSYYFARIPHCWGWASWKRAWIRYSFDITDFESFVSGRQIKNIFKRKCSQQYFINIFEKMTRHEIDTWDYQWTYTVMSHNGFAVIPCHNMIRNIGFGAGATHTTGNSIYCNQETYDLTTIKHPQSIKVDMHLIEKINIIGCGIESKYAKQCKKILRLFRLLFHPRTLFFKLRMRHRRG